MADQKIIMGGAASVGTELRPAVRLIEMQDTDGHALAVSDTWVAASIAAIEAQQAAIIALLTEIRDDQRAAQGNTATGRVLRTKAIVDGLL